MNNLVTKLKQKWVEVALGIATIVTSFIVAFFTATYVTHKEYEKGDVLLGELGFRYFYNYHRAFDSSSGKVRQDALTRKIYEAELEAILTDLTSLSDNPIYVHIAQRTSGMPLLISEIRAELIALKEARQFSISRRTAKFMCLVFVEDSPNSFQIPTEDGVHRDIHTFAQHICT